MAPEELEALIQERMGLIEKEEQAQKEAMNPKTETLIPQQQIQEERFEQNKMEVEFSHQQQQQRQIQEIQLEENGKFVFQVNFSFNTLFSGQLSM